MRIANQLTFTTYEASLKLSPNDPTKIISTNIDWSFIHPLVSGKYPSQVAEGYDPISLYKAQRLIYLGEINSAPRKPTVTTKTAIAWQVPG